MGNEHEEGKEPFSMDKPADLSNPPGKTPILGEASSSRPPLASSVATVKTGNKTKPPTTALSDVVKPMKEKQQQDSGLDAVSEGQEKEEIERVAHRRSVSWGQNKLLEANDASTHHVGPVSNITTSTNLPTTSPLSEPRKQPINGRYSLQDVTQVNPKESEAETYILQALEKRDPTIVSSSNDASATRDRSNSVFSNLDDSAAEALSAAHSQPGASLRSSSSSSRLRGGMAAGRPPIALQKSNRFLQAAKAAHHRRTATTEKKLEGLTAAIDAVNALHQHHISDDIPNVIGDDSHHGQQLRERIHTLESVHEYKADVPHSAADALGHNASVLYNRMKKDDKAPPPPPMNASLSDKSADERWRQLRHTLRATSVTKKDDDAAAAGSHTSSVLDDDLETGGLSSPLDDSLVDDAEVRRKTQKFLYSDWQVIRELDDFFTPRRGNILSWIKILIVYVCIPLIGVAAILFYLGGNPPTGRLANHGRPVNGTLLLTDGSVADPNQASASWWLLFVLRQLLMAGLAKFMELFFIDFLSIRQHGTSRLLGPWVTLFVLQSKGWPFLLFMWAVFDFILLSGTRPFFAHWAYWQDYIDIFNRSNPSGYVVDSALNHRLLAVALCVGAAVAAKRFWLGLYLGRQTFTQYSDKLTSVMGRILLISEVAALGREFEKHALMRSRSLPPRQDAVLYHMNSDRFQNLMEDAAGDSDTGGGLTYSRETEDGGEDDVEFIIDPDDRHPLTGSLASSQKARISQLLGMWEEPTVAEKPLENISVGAILQFRRAVACLHGAFPFSGCFGLADTRENCIESAQDTFYRLMLRTPDEEMLTFDILAILGVRRDGSLDHDKLKDLIRLFRPDRDGTLRLLDFVKSIDAVYKEVRLLRASIANASKIDHSFEAIFNFVYYAVLFTIILSQLGFDPLALFLSISGVVLAFAFMIGSASSKYFEGLLFILARRPYTIGETMHVSDVESDTDGSGSPWWTVEDLNLFSTSVVFSFTGERATLSNGSLANSRIINASRSPQACLFILVKFPIDITYEKLEIFKKAIEQYIKNRPREWISSGAIRMTRAEVDAGFVEYIVVGTHRQGWSEWGALQSSKAEMLHFALELQKRLGERYHSPALPVDIRMSSDRRAAATGLLGVAPSGEETDKLPVAMSQQDLNDLLARFGPREKKK